MIRTIIVDDELLAGVGIQSLIHGKEGITVSGLFPSAEDALAYLRENVVDVVITDIEMGGMNGLDFIQAVRENRLADGIIILSCHDDFSYAQEAISKGTDGYLLKHQVTEKLLTEEIRKVYRKRRGSRMPGEVRERCPQKSAVRTGEELFIIAALQMASYECPVSGEQGMERTMLIHLLEGIVARRGAGTLYSPYNRKIFLILPLDRKIPGQERRTMVRDYLSAIDRNLQQYINGRIRYGVSTEYTDEQEIHAKYNEAVAAFDMSFYHPEEIIFFYCPPAVDFLFSGFSLEHFLEPNGLELFQDELSECLRQAYSHRLPVGDLRAQLILAAEKLRSQVLRQHRFSDALSGEWGYSAEMASVIAQSGNAGQLRSGLLEVMEHFHRECLAELGEDKLSLVLEYIDLNLGGKLNLQELAAIGCMSVPTFSKRIKERTGMTLVHYLNERRIERAKQLLKNPTATLEEIAAAAGFSNANYLTRVFKKVTGQTISDYRR